MADLIPVIGAAAEPILDDTFAIWHEGLSRPAYGKWWAAQLGTPWARSHLSRIALVDRGQTLASAKLYELDAILDGQPIRVLGIGAVFTTPSLRRRGAGRELIERVVESASMRGFDAALLFSEIGSEYYARLGFVTVPLLEATLRVVEDRRRGAPATMVRAGDDRDLKDVVAMDAARGEPFRFHLQRTSDLVHYSLAKKRLLAGLAPAGARAVHFFIAEEGASAVAYVVVSVTGDHWSIESCGDRDPAGARLGAILQVLIAREPAEHRPAITGWLPVTLRPPQLTIVRAEPARDIMMIRPLSDVVRRAAPLRQDDVLFWRGDAF